MSGIQPISGASGAYSTNATPGVSSSSSSSDISNASSNVSSLIQQLPANMQANYAGQLASIVDGNDTPDSIISQLNDLQATVQDAVTQSQASQGTIDSLTADASNLLTQVPSDQQADFSSQLASITGSNLSQDEQVTQLNDLQTQMQTAIAQDQQNQTAVNQELSDITSQASQLQDPARTNFIYQAQNAASQNQAKLDILNDLSTIRGNVYDAITRGQNV